MATIVPRQGPELEQDERVGLLAAQPNVQYMPKYDKIGGEGWGGWFWGVRGGFLGGPPDPPKTPPGGVKIEVLGGPPDPPKPPKIHPPLIKDRFFRFWGQNKSSELGLVP